MAQFIEVDINGTIFYIESEDIATATAIDSSGRPQVVRTGVSTELHKAYDKAKATIIALAMDLDKDVSALPQGKGPGQVELELSLGFSTQVGAWVLGAKTDSAIKVKFSWKR